MYTNTYCVCTQCTQLYCSGKRGWVVYGVCRINFLSNFHIQKVIIGLDLKIRIMSNVKMLKHNIIYKRCLVNILQIVFKTSEIVGSGFSRIFFSLFLICISIDSEWSKTYQFEGKFKIASK